MKKLSNVKKGKIGELKAKTFLLENGYKVFENVCDDDGEDFVILHDNKLKTLQVKYALNLSSFKTTKRIAFKFGNTNTYCDLIMCVFDKYIWLIPKEAIKSKNAFNIYPYGSNSKLNKYLIKS